MHRFLLRALVVVVALALLAPWSVHSARAAPTWTGQALPVLPNSDHAALHGVDCVSDTVCTVVGFSAQGSTYVPLAERWNGGTSWTIQSVAKPAGTSPRFEGVSCVGANPCLAVGLQQNGNVKAFSERWNGTSWVLKAMLNPGGSLGDTVANDVSCSAGNACTAVGAFWNGTRFVPLAEGWNGSSWSRQTVARPAGAEVSVLKSVHCATASSCVAVGYFTTSPSEGGPVIYGWNGTVWTIQPAPTIAGAVAAVLEGVSCSSVNACTAVGYSVTAAGVYRTLALRWNGSSWVLQTSPIVSNAWVNLFFDVSCASATACTAVGYSEVEGADRKTLAQRWNGTTWTISPTPTYPNTIDAELHGVDCTTAALCTAVGFSKVGSGPSRQLALRYA